MSISIFEKTLRYNLTLDANPVDVANTTATTIGSNTIYIPENEPGKPVRIASALVYFTHQDTSTVTGATISNLNVSATINAVAASTITDANVVTNTGENWSGLRGPYNFTNYVNDNWGGTSDSASFSVAVTCNITTGTGVTTRANYAWVELTYEYSASAANRGQTICYPLPQANVGALPSPNPTFFADIPQLTGIGGLFDGYNSFEIRDAYIEIRANSNVNNTPTDNIMRYSITAGASQNLPIRENALASDTYCSYHVPYPVSSGSAPNTLNLGCDTATRFHNPAVYLWITGQYIESGTTSFINWLSFPVEANSTIIGIAASEKIRYNRTIRIPESNPVTYISAAVEFFFIALTAPQFFIKYNTESTYRTYSTVQTQVCGQSTALYYISSSALNLTTGSNEINIDFYKNTAVTNVSGICNILYKTPTYISGSDYHSKVVKSLHRQYVNSVITNGVQSNVNSNFTPIETYYYFHSLSNVYNFQFQYTSHQLSVSTQQLSGENYGATYIDTYLDRSISDSEVAWMTTYVPLREYFKRFPGDVGSNRLDVTTLRNYRIIIDGVNYRYGSWWQTCYHCMSYSVHGSISDSNSGTVTIELFRASNDELLQRTTRSGDGTFSFRVYDQEEYYVTAYENENFKGISRISSSDNSFNISLSGGSGTTEHSYTWIG
jgi:hypothetical protein